VILLEGVSIGQSINPSPIRLKEVFYPAGVRQKIGFPFMPGISTRWRFFGAISKEI